jgi:copper(I)-binding protein
MASASPDAMPGSGMLGMQKIDRLEIPAGGSVELKPGSYHLMLIGPTQELTVGDTIEMTLDFEKAGPVKVTAEVREG